MNDIGRRKVQVVFHLQDCIVNEDCTFQSIVLQSLNTFDNLEILWNYYYGMPQDKYKHKHKLHSIPNICQMFLEGSWFKDIYIYISITNYQIQIILHLGQFGDRKIWHQHNFAPGQFGTTVYRYLLDFHSQLFTGLSQPTVITHCQTQNMIVLNKLAKARKTRTSPSTLGLKKFGLGKLWVKKVFQVKKVFWV